MKSAALSYRPIQENESKRLAMDLVRDPKNFDRHLERYAASVIMTVAYARRVDDMNDPAVQMVLEMMQYMASLNVPGRFLAESFPILAKFPDWLSPWKREVKKNAAYYGRDIRWKILTEGKFFFTLGMRAKTRYDNGTLPNCFAKQLWDQREKHNLTDIEVSGLSGGLFGAGSDTSSATMTTFILAMTVFGDKVIPKAQEELDRVVGRNRSPTWTDEENLPYIRAVVKEAFRWRPVAVLGGTPHANTEDDYYNGYLIPKGSTILGNLWAVCCVWDLNSC
jgi:cytochrome P450